MLTELYTIPDGLLSLEATQLEEVLGGPTLLHLKGRREPSLFISVLLHGNETTGWEAVRALLRRYDGGQISTELPRSICLFIGNVSAAAEGLRRLDGQPDYNRVWTGCEGRSDSPEHKMMQQVLDTMHQRGLFASVDIHNNTGLNPHYACINRPEDRFFHLATLFSRTVVYFLRPCGVQSMAMAQLCPAVTLECGRPGQTHGVEHAIDYLDACLHLAEHPQHPIADHDMDLFHTMAQVKVPETVDFGFGLGDLDLYFAEDLDHLNFRELPRGTRFGEVRNGLTVPLEIRDERGELVTDRYFQVDDGELLLRTPAMPSMLSLDERVIRQDCLCYLMERVAPGDLRSRNL
ncbi:MAG: peptidase M14 [Gammaproteobacteria bacterium]|nr:peptidase M14 [Gammaproteobacteria bacterium]